MIAIHMLPAKEGDFIWLEYGGEALKSHILIDGGVNVTGNVFAKIIEKIYSQGEKIEALILTHIDYDHIQGAITGLEKVSKEVLENVINRIIFNTSKGIEKAQITTRNEATNWEEVISVKISSGGYGVGDAISFINLLKKKGLVCRLIDYIVAGDIINISSGAQIKIISPTYIELQALLDNWEEYEKNDEPVAYASNSEVIQENITDLMKEKLYYDSSVNNKSSIAFIFEYCDKRIVFLGDANPTVCINGLKDQKIDLPYVVDAIKISHHGSRSNTSDKLLKALPTKNYLLSTNGKNQKVPSKVVIAHILKCSKCETTKIYCNYKWWKTVYHDRYFTDDDKKIYLDINKLEIIHVDSHEKMINQGMVLYGKYKSNK